MTAVFELLTVVGEENPFSDLYRELNIETSKQEEFRWVPITFNLYWLATHIVHSHERDEEGEMVTAVGTDIPPGNMDGNSITLRIREKELWDLLKPYLPK